MQAGFFNQQPKKKQVIEDVTHVKAVTKNETLKIEEVQSAMSAEKIAQTKDQWMTPELLQTLMSKPHMMQVLQDPMFSTVLSEMQKDPKVAMQKYGQSGKFKEFMMEFAQIMGVHFESVADKEKKKAEEAEAKKLKEEEAMKSDPVYQLIQNDP